MYRKMQLSVKFCCEYGLNVGHLVGPWAEMINLCFLSIINLNFSSCFSIGWTQQRESPSKSKEYLPSLCTLGSNSTQLILANQLKKSLATNSSCKSSWTFCKVGFLSHKNFQQSLLSQPFSVSTFKLDLDIGNFKTCKRKHELCHT